MKNAKFRWWMLTINNPKEDWRTVLSELKSDYCIGQLERGENGTPHIQACCWFKDPIRPSHWKDQPYWTKGLSSDQAAERVQAYCSKENTRLDGPFQIGTKPVQRNSKLDWEATRTLAKEGRFDEIDPSIVIKHYTNLKKINADYTVALETNEVRGLWVYGKPGMGKSYYARSISADLYNKAQNKWWDGYKQQKTVLLDDFDHGGKCLAHYLKIWADRYAAHGEVKGATVALNYDTFIITSNYLPNDIWSAPEDSTLLEAIERRFTFVVFDGFGSYQIGNRPGIIPQTTHNQYILSLIE